MYNTFKETLETTVLKISKTIKNIYTCIKIFNQIYDVKYKRYEEFD